MTEVPHSASSTGVLLFRGVSKTYIVSSYSSLSVLDKPTDKKGKLLPLPKSKFHK